MCDNLPLLVPTPDVPDISNVAMGSESVEIYEQKKVRFYEFEKSLSQWIVCIDWEKVYTVATNINDIKTVATNIDSVKSVALNMPTLITVAENIPDIKTVATSITNINTVATNILQIDGVYNIIEQILVLYQNMMKVVTVSESMKKLEAIYDDLDMLRSLSCKLSIYQQQQSFVKEFDALIVPPENEVILKNGFLGRLGSIILINGENVVTIDDTDVIVNNRNIRFKENFVGWTAIFNYLTQGIPINTGGGATDNCNEVSDAGMGYDRFGVCELGSSSCTMREVKGMGGAEFGKWSFGAC